MIKDEFACSNHETVQQYTHHYCPYLQDSRFHFIYAYPLQDPKGSCPGEWKGSGELVVLREQTPQSMRSVCLIYFLGITKPLTPFSTVTFWLIHDIQTGRVADKVGGWLFRLLGWNKWDQLYRVQLVDDHQWHSLGVYTGDDKVQVCSLMEHRAFLASLAWESCQSWTLFVV